MSRLPISINFELYDTLKFQKIFQKILIAHREGRTRSLQISIGDITPASGKSLTLYPIELGGRC